VYSNGETIYGNYPFCVNSTVTSVQRNPSVATDGSLFLVVWESLNKDADGYAVIGRFVNTDGTFATDEFMINTSTNNDQINPRAVYNGTHFLVVWESHHIVIPPVQVKKEIFGQLIDTTGAKIGSEIYISEMTVLRYHFKPDVASYDGKFMVVWHTSNNDIYARGISSSGLRNRDIIYVSEAANAERNVSIASNGKSYFITWEYDLTAPEKAIYACCIDNKADFIETPFKVNQSTGYALSNPCIASDSLGNFAVAWQSELQDNDGSGIFAREITYKGITISVQPEPQIYTDGDTLTFEITASSSYLPLSYQWYKGSLPVGDNSPVLVLENLQEADQANVYCVVTDKYGSVKSDNAYIEYQKLEIGFVLKQKKFVNENTTDYQDKPAIASNGTNYMIAWEMLNQSGSILDIKGRQYDNEGNPDGAEFVVSNDPDNQYNPDIAFNGMFYLVVWESYQGSYMSEIYAQWYEADGTPLGTSFRVNTDRSYNQKRPAVTTNGSSFMVVWESQNSDSAGYGIKGCVIASESTVPGSEILINQITTGNQNKPDIAWNGSKYLAVWHSDENVAYKIQARFLLSDGSVGGDEFNIAYNSSLGYNFTNPCVASAGTTFMIVYETWDDDYSRVEARGELLNNAGEVIDSFEFENWYVSGYERGVKVSASQWDYLVAWEVWDYDITKSRAICAKRIYHDGATVYFEDEFTIIDYSNYPSHSPKNIGIGTNGSDFLIAWSKYNASNHSEGIYACQLIYTNPVLTVDASDKWAYEGENVVCRIEPGFFHGDLHYSWFYNGVSYGSDTNSITLPAVELSDNDSEYYCVVSDAETSTTTKTGKLYVNKTPLGYSISDETYLYFDNEYNQSYPAVCAGGSNFLSTYSTAYADTWYIKLKSKLIPTQSIPTDVVSPAPDGQMLYSKVAFNGTKYIAVWCEGLFECTIKGQFFDSTGSKIGSAFTISQTELETYPDLDVASNGSSFFVVWSGEIYGVTEGLDIYGRIVNSNGTFATSELIIAQSVNDDTKPHIACNGSNFLIVWHQETSIFTGDVYAKLYTSAGTEASPVVQVNQDAGNAYYSINLCSSGSDFIAIWADDHESSYDYKLYGQKINAAGALAGSAFVITDNVLYTSGVEILATPYEILAIWTSRDNSTDIDGRFFDFDGTPVSDEFKINTHLNSSQANPFASYNGTSFFIGWESFTQTKAYKSILYKTLTYNGPYFTQQPVSQTVQEGSNVTFTVSTHHHGSVSYNWYKLLGIKAVLVGTGPELVLENVPYSSFPKVYYCVATDSFGAVQSNMATLTVIENLKVVTHPQDQSTYEHEAVTFSVTANYTDVQYQWFKQGTPDIFLSGENGKDLYMEDPLLVVNNTYYYCRITRGTETVYSNPAHLTVSEPEFYVSIVSPDSIYGNSDTYNIGYSCNAYAHYDTGTVSINDSVTWEVTPSSVAYMQGNMLRTLAIDGDTKIILKASYTDTALGVTHWRQKTISVVNLLQVTGMLPLPETTFSMSPDTIHIDFSRNIKYSAPGTSIFIISAGEDNEFGTDDDIGIPVVITSPDETNYIDLDLNGYLFPEGLLKIKIAELHAMNGLYLDGEFEGSFPSGNFESGGSFEAIYNVDGYNITAFSVNSDNTVSIEWEPFKTGCFYEVVYCDNLESLSWHVVKPASQFPITSINWTGDNTNLSKGRLYKVNGMMSYISSLTPNSGYVGDQNIDITINGYNTSWDSLVNVTMGDGITVEAITVINSSQLLVRIDISASAQAGLRNVSVTTSTGKSALKRDGFEILE